MEKNGKHPRTGSVSLPPSSDRDKWENLPKPPVNVKPAKLSALALADRSLLSVSFRHIKPNWRAYVQYAELAAKKGDTAMARFVKAYESLTPQARRALWPEQICDLAQIEPGELYGAVCRQLWETKAVESSTICSIEHPELLMNTIRFARKEENYKDRELFFSMSGSLPNKKGTSINIFNAATGQTIEAPDLVSGHRLKSFDQEIIDIDRDVETEASAPFLVKEDDVPS